MREIKQKKNLFLFRRASWRRRELTNLFERRPSKQSEGLLESVRIGVTGLGDWGAFLG